MSNYRTFRIASPGRLLLGLLVWLTPGTLSARACSHFNDDLNSLFTTIRPAPPLVNNTAINPGGTSVFTPACADTQVIQTTFATNNLNTYLTTITAELAGGAFLFDQSFNLPFSDPTVQAAILQAQGLLTNAGALSFTGPILGANTQSQSTAVNTVVTSSITDKTTPAVGTATTFGPARILIGDLGLCQGVQSTPPPPFNDYVTLSLFPFCCPAGVQFFVLPGQLVINAFVTHETDITQLTTTTNTTLTSQTYNLTGNLGPLAPVPEPGTFGLLGCALGLIAVCGKNRRNRGDSCSTTNWLLGLSWR
jgi:hypothetical protein